VKSWDILSILSPRANLVGKTEEAGCHRREAGCRALVKPGCCVFCEAGCRCAPFRIIKHRLLAYLFTAWLFPTGVRSACKETMYGEERETGLEPATACLEGRNSTTLLW